MHDKYYIKIHQILRKIHKYITVKLLWEFLVFWISCNCHDILNRCHQI